MRKETIYENKSLYRDSFRIEGYYFGEGEPTLCIVGNLRGNEYQQVYTCSKLIQELKDAEEAGLLADGKEILVIPSANPYSMNIGKRFWPIDDTDINRMFPGYDLGETTQRIAHGLFQYLQEYPYGIQYASNYMPGRFMPHVNIQRTGLEDTELAKAFGLPYVVVHRTRPFDTTTLNYNWQIWNTKAYSLYTTSTERVDRAGAHRGVQAVFRFMAEIGCLKQVSLPPGFVSQQLDSDEMVSVRSNAAGFFEPDVVPGQEVKTGDVLARILNPLDGEELSQVIAPTDSIVFYIHDGQLTYAKTAVIKLVPIK